ncbi:MAG: DUF488 domain-containing protein [Deltaproteobacteria bacterium]|nr:DUF488 domain-containing protein [Deltaproteobacteria bacterium]
MLYSIGYQKLSIERFITELSRRDINYLVDVRSKPVSRKVGFSRGPLVRILERENIIYRWKGDVLGGFSQISEGEIISLAKWQEDKIACMLCMEADYKQCHRYYEIAKRLEKYGVTVNHIKGE